MANHFIVFILSILTVIIIRFLKKSFSTEYFSLYQIIADEDPFTFLGFMIVMVPPFIGSMFLAVILGEENLSLIIVYGFLSAFMIIWPILSYPKELLSPQAYIKRKSVYFIYFLFVATYIVLAYGGYSFYYGIINIEKNRASVLYYIFEIYDELPLMIQGILDNINWALVLLLISLIKKKIKRRIKEDYQNLE